MLKQRSFLGRWELVEWLNSLLMLDYTCAEDCSDGVAYLQILDAVFPGKAPMHKLDFNAKTPLERARNLRLVEKTLAECGVEYKLPFDGICRGTFQDNFDCLQYFHGYVQKNCPSAHLVYDGAQRRRTAARASTSSDTTRSSRSDVKASLVRSLDPASVRVFQDAETLPFPKTPPDNEDDTARSSKSSPRIKSPHSKGERVQQTSANNRPPASTASSSAKKPLTTSARYALRAMESDDSDDALEDAKPTSGGAGHELRSQSPSGRGRDSGESAARLRGGAGHTARPASVPAERCDEGMRNKWAEEPEEGPEPGPAEDDVVSKLEDLMEVMKEELTMRLLGQAEEMRHVDSLVKERNALYEKLLRIDEVCELAGSFYIPQQILTITRKYVPCMD